MRKALVLAFIVSLITPKLVIAGSNLDAVRLEIVSEYDKDNPEQRTRVTKLSSTENKSVTVIGYVKLTTPAGMDPQFRWYVMTWLYIDTDGKTEILVNQENDKNLQFKRTPPLSLNFYKVYKPISWPEEETIGLAIFSLTENK